MRSSETVCNYIRFVISKFISQMLTVNLILAVPMANADRSFIHRTFGA